MLFSASEVWEGEHAPTREEHLAGRCPVLFLCHPLENRKTSRGHEHRPPAKASRSTPGCVGAEAWQDHSD